jgi:hypothetical protein
VWWYRTLESESKGQPQSKSECSIEDGDSRVHSQHSGNESAACEGKPYARAAVTGRPARPLEVEKRSSSPVGGGHLEDSVK